MDDGATEHLRAIVSARESEAKNITKKFDGREQKMPTHELGSVWKGHRQRGIFAVHFLHLADLSIACQSAHNEVMEWRRRRRRREGDRRRNDMTGYDDWEEGNERTQKGEGA